ncbi:hypothetical protein HIM_01166 [Hirsutella minnesotensis 3608]|nr:hypothetical protein HIM_01166 [Hirsutella minnesotensis 3608]
MSPSAESDGLLVLPIVMPYSLAGFALPLLWLTIPHSRRPILYQTRWLVLILVLAFTGFILYEGRRTTTANLAFAGAIGMWCSIASAYLLIWSNAQSAARVVRVRRRTARSPTSACNDEKGSTPSDEKTSLLNKSEEETCDVWQTFPDHGTFRQRLGWVVDMALSLRGSGWSFAIASIPRPRIPSTGISDGDAVDVREIPISTKCGFTRCRTEGDFFRQRVTAITIRYLIIDVCCAIMRPDPYFTHGPDYTQPLPPHLAQMSAWLLRPYREIVALAYTIAALDAVLLLFDFLQYWFLKTFCPSRALLWSHASAFGSFSLILDRGLAGFWGSTWHQTFRLGFLGPASYIRKHGYLPKGSSIATISTLFITFIQSGLLHTAAGVACSSNSRPWRSMVFYPLQAIGILAQQLIAKSLNIKVSPAVGRTANALFTLAWMYATAMIYLDDVAQNGFFLLEPLPISPLRWFTSGKLTTQMDSLIFWYPGEHWSMSGVALVRSVGSK